MKKRLTALLLAFALIFALLPAAVITAGAEITLPPDEFGENTVSGTCGAEGDNLTWTLNTATGVLEITGTGEMDDWSRYGSPWYFYCDSIKTVSIGSGVTSISDSAFDGCTGLTSVTIPDSVTSIGVRAFEACTSLTSVTIPDSVTSIGYGAFEVCTSLTSVTIGNSVTSIGDYAFAWCAGLTSVTLPDSVTSIGDYAFSGCTKLTSVTIPDGVTSIGAWAFEACMGLTSVTIPDSVTSIGYAAFIDCTGLISITVDENNSIYDSRGDCNAIIETATNTLIFGCMNTTIPDSVTSISDYAFYNCTGLTSVMIPDSVTSIGYSAFSGCTGLTSIAIPDSVTSIGVWAFYGCTGLTSVTIPDSVTSIGNTAFGYYWDDENFEYIKVDGFTISGYQGSAAQAYAEENGFTFVNLGDAPVDPTDPTEPTEAPTEPTTAPTEPTTAPTEPTTAPTEPTTAPTEPTTAPTEATEPTTPTEPVEPVKFNDVNETAWYYEAVNYAVQNKLMNGVGNNNFAPDDPMTRSMLVTVLWRYEGSPKEGTNDFTDVPAGQWYTDAVAWAATNGIVGGVGNGKFDPNGNITREQMAAILYRYADKKGFDTAKRGDLSGFPDQNKVSAYATDAIAWAVAEKIIGGSNGKLDPQGNATRAQVSTILMRFIEGIAKK